MVVWHKVAPIDLLGPLNTSSSIRPHCHTYKGTAGGMETRQSNGVESFMKIRMTIVEGVFIRNDRFCSCDTVRGIQNKSMDLLLKLISTLKKIYGYNITLISLHRTNRS